MIKRNEGESQKVALVNTLISAISVVIIHKEDASIKELKNMFPEIDIREGNLERYEVYIK